MNVKTLPLMMAAAGSIFLLGFKSGAAQDDEEMVLRAQDVQFEQIAPFVKMGAAWGNRAEGEHGTFGVFPGGASSPWHTHSGTYHGVVLSGTMTNPFRGEDDPPQMTAGSAWTVPAGSEHVTACVSQQPCLFYFHAGGAFDFAPVGN